MARNTFGRLLFAAAGVIALVCALGPQAALADDPVLPPDLSKISQPDPTGNPADHITIHISDTGFDKKEYTVKHFETPVKEHLAFVNDGTMVHNATLVPGTTPGKDGLWSFTCFPVCTNDGQRFKKTISFDTGGIAPGDTKAGSFISSGDKFITSATDCLYGNRTPGFDCTPVVIHVKSVDTGSLNDQLNGTALLPPTPDNLSKCVHFVDPHDGAPPACWQLGWTPGNIGGSKAAPLSGNVVVKIDDVNGYDPAQVFITPDSSVTWVNTSCCRVHELYKSGSGSGTYNGFQFFDSGGIGPGQSWTYQPCTPSTLNICKTDFQYQSNAETEISDPAWSGQANQSTGFAFSGEVTVVVPKK
jgi:plastocyanin